MPALDNCVNFVFEPGAIPGSSGATPTIPVVPTFEDPDNYNPDAVTYSLNGTKFYNSMYWAIIAWPL